MTTAQIDKFNVKKAVKNEKWETKQIALTCNVNSSINRTGYCASDEWQSWSGTFQIMYFRAFRLLFLPLNVLSDRKESVSATVNLDSEDRTGVPLTVKLVSDRKPEDWILRYFDAFFSNQT